MTGAEDVVLQAVVLLALAALVAGFGYAVIDNWRRHHRRHRHRRRRRRR